VDGAAKVAWVQESPIKVANAVLTLCSVGEAEVERQSRYLGRLIITRKRSSWSAMLIG